MVGLVALIVAGIALTVVPYTPTMAPGTPDTLAMRYRNMAPGTPDTMAMRDRNRPNSRRSTTMAPGTPDTLAMNDRLASDGIDAAECLIIVVRHLGTAQQQTSSELAAERAQRQQLELRVRELEQMRLCTICLDRTRQVALQL